MLDKVTTNSACSASTSPSPGTLTKRLAVRGKPTSTIASRVGRQSSNVNADWCPASVQRGAA
jgi:hypothetical protein